MTAPGEGTEERMEPRSGGPFTVPQGKDVEIAALRTEIEGLKEQESDLRERNTRMRGFIQRHGYGHTDWPEDKTGCQKPGPGCPGRCIARCEDVDNLNVVLHAERTARLAAEGALVFLRDEWSPVGAQMCPACVYDDGRFIRRCKVHEWGDALKAGWDAAEATLARVRAALGGMRRLAGGRDHIPGAIDDHALVVELSGRLHAIDEAVVDALASPEPKG